MRGLTKGAPPNNVSPPGQQPRSLAAADAAYQQSLVTAADPVAHARSEFDCMHKRYLRDLLFVEQRCLCVYCERAIDEVHPPPPVDHWNPLSLYLHQVFDWNNLHLSCRTIDTCDDRKKCDAVNLPWPANFKFEDVLGFTSGGRLYVRTDVHVPPPLQQALEIAIEDQPGPPVARSTLNLNHPALREARAAAIEIEEGEPPAQRPARVAALLAQRACESFISARLATLNGQLGAGR